MNKILEFFRRLFRGFMTPVSLNPRFKTHKEPRRAGLAAASTQTARPARRAAVIDARPPICVKCGRDVSNPLTHTCRKEPKAAFLVFDETISMSREEWQAMVDRLDRREEWNAAVDISQAAKERAKHFETLFNNSWLERSGVPKDLINPRCPSCRKFSDEMPGKNCENYDNHIKPSDDIYRPYNGI